MKEMKERRTEMRQRKDTIEGGSQGEREGRKAGMKTSRGRKVKEGE